MSTMILPSPDPAFEWRQTPVGPALVCAPLDRHAAHLFTTRHWALGASAVTADDEAPWREVAGAMDVTAPRLVRLRQVHGRTIVEARADRLDTADIILSDDRTLAIAVQGADCVPLLLADARTGAVTAAHAGWRGLAARVPEAAVAAMTTRFGSRPEDLIAAAGPSIGACCYEVGPDVRSAFGAAGFDERDIDAWFLRAPSPTVANPSMPALVTSGRHDRWFFDGWASVAGQLAAAGLHPDRIFVARTCTASHPVFCSYRRDGASAGRLAGAIRPR